jgi:hypothetical protein
VGEIEIVRFAAAVERELRRRGTLVRKYPAVAASVVKREFGRDQQPGRDHGVGTIDAD